MAIKGKIFINLTLFATVEPCILCAYALNFIGFIIQKVIEL